MLTVALALLGVASARPDGNQFTASVGACRGGLQPERYAGLKFYRDRGCQARCIKAGAACQGYVLPVSGSYWCETYTSEGATGDGRTRFMCYMKSDAVVTPAPIAAPPSGNVFTMTMGACRGGQTPARNAGLRFFRDRKCEERCVAAGAACQGYVLPVSPSNWCETYTSVGAKGDGRKYFKCWTKTDEIDTEEPTSPPTSPPQPVPTEPPTPSPTLPPTVDCTTYEFYSALCARPLGDKKPGKVCKKRVCKWDRKTQTCNPVPKGDKMKCGKAKASLIFRDGARTLCSCLPGCKPGASKNGKFRCKGVARFL